MKKIISVFLAITFVFAFSVLSSARLVGDVNSDGATNSSDALAILKYSVGAETEINEKYADIDGDGAINSSDALLVLQIAVGSYEGELEVEDDDKLVTSYKKDVVDPIMSTGKFTLKSLVYVDGQTTPTTVMMDGDDFCIETEAAGQVVRVLMLGTKTYMVMPDFPLPGIGVYMEYAGVGKPSLGSGEDAEYVGSEYVTVEGEELLCETYKLSDGTVSEYYFKDGQWVRLSVTSDGETKTQKIVELKSGVDASKFSLDGFIAVDSEK